MIAITTDSGTLRIAGEIPIPNGQAWSATRISQLFAHIERFVFAAELTDKDLPRSEGEFSTLPPRKPNFKSGLVVIPEVGPHSGGVDFDD